MKEYKVISWKMSLSKNNDRLEETLNKHAVSGWRMVHFSENSLRIILERDKNR